MIRVRTGTFRTAVLGSMGAQRFVRKYDASVTPRNVPDTVLGRRVARCQLAQLNA